MSTVLVFRIRILRLLRVSGIVRHVRMFLLLITFLKAYDSFRLFFFFFSSRRRHTRFDCDWSSDVCSSDLDESKHRLAGLGTQERLDLRRQRQFRWRRHAARRAGGEVLCVRSEEEVEGV